MSDSISENGRGQTSKATGSVRQRTELDALAMHVRNNQKRLKESLNRLQESLDYLRLATKYQLFDLEATRRENAYLKKLLEERH
jgi:hypothetical protein